MYNVTEVLSSRLLTFAEEIFLERHHLQQDIKCASTEDNGKNSISGRLLPTFLFL